MKFLQCDEKAPAPRPWRFPGCERESCGSVHTHGAAAQARTKKKASAAAEQAANVPILTRSNRVLRIRSERTNAQFDSREAHRSCRFSVPLIANPGSSPMSFLC